MSLLAALLVVSIGALIGAVGLGGFLLVPLLVLLEGVSVRQGVVVAAIAFLAAGLATLLLRRGSPREARGHAVFLLAAAPGAILGSLAVRASGETMLGVVIAIGFAAAGVAEWRQWPASGAPRQVPRAAVAGGGVVTGFASALTGTSGPMVAMPLLAWTGMGLHDRVALAQVAQIPIALGATLAFASLGDVPWRLAAACGAALCVGLAMGMRTARRVEPPLLRRLAAVLMIAAAVAMLIQALR